MNLNPTVDELFEHRITYPDVDPKERLSRLIGLDEQKSPPADVGQPRRVMAERLGGGYGAEVAGGSR